MPVSSYEIAQLNNAFQNQSYNNIAYSNAIGQGPVYGGGMTGGYTGDRYASHALNSAASIGAPLAMGALGLAGLDPIGLGWRAGSAAYGMGGFGGAAIAGGAAMLPAMAAYAGASYAGNQMYEGAQQQVGFNNLMRNSFTFRNQYGGQGFARNEMSQIATQVREMTHQFGPGGEVANFSELSQLAGRMGSMGFARGVQDVKEFASKFKEMVGHLKTMAKELGTTMEGAMEFASAAKNFGIFGMRGATSFAKAVRQGAVAGDVSVSEFTSSASFGSQVARSIGGLGVQGANAGVLSMGQVSMANKMGILSEEDIYNITGLNGAEGRQAYVQSGLSRAGRWLSGSRGRRLVASVAGEDGALDQDAVQKLMSGGMTIEETIAEGNRMKRVVGRENFLRNEGKLRGAALERFGMFLPAMQMMDWLGGKGLTVDTMNDRSMLMMKRQLGMSHDELDQAVKMVRNMPNIMERQAIEKENTEYLDKVAQDRKLKGIHGIENRMEQAREHVEGYFQSIGARVLNDASELRERFLGHLSDQYIAVGTDDLDRVVREFSATGKGDKLALDRLFNKDAFGKFTAIGSTAGPRTFADFTRGGDASMFSVARIFKGESDASRMLGAGYDVMGRARTLEAGGAGETQALEKALSEARAFADSTKSTSLDYLAAGFSKRALIRDIYATGDVAGTKGQVRPEAFRKALAERAWGDADAKQLLAAYDKVPDGQRGIFINSIESVAGIPDAARLSNMSGLPDLNKFSRSFVSVTERNEAYGSAVTNREGWMKGRGGSALQYALLGGATGALVGASVFGPVGAIAGGLFGATVGGIGGYLIHGEEMARRERIGGLIASKEGLESVQRLFSSDTETRQRMREQLQNDLATLKAENKEDSAEAETKMRLLAASEYRTHRDNILTMGKHSLVFQSLQTAYKTTGMRSPEDFERNYQNILGVAGTQAQEERSAELARMRDRYGKEGTTLRGTGLDVSVFSQDDKGAYHMSSNAMGKTALSQQAQEFLAAAALEVDTGAHVTDITSGIQWRDAASRKDMLRGGLSMEDLRNISKRASGTAPGRLITSQLAIAKRIEAARGEVGQVGAGLGLKLSMKERQKLHGHMGETADAMVSHLLPEGTDDRKKELKQQVLEYQRDVSQKHFAAAAAKAQGILGGDVGEYRAKKEHDAQEARDPVSSEIRDNTKQMAEHLRTLAESGVRIRSGSTPLIGPPEAPPKK